MDTPFFSEKARGKKRALEVDDEREDVAEMMELDNGSDSSEGELQQAGPSTSTSSKIPRRRHDDAGTPSSTRSMSTEMGGSISRAARMRATTTEDEGGSGSDSPSVDDSGASDNDMQNSTHNITKNGKKLSNGASKSFVTASNGEAYLRAMSRPAKTSNKKLSESWSDPCKPFTQSSLLSALSSAASSSTKAKITDKKLLQLEDAYSALHDQWFFELEQGFSVFFYGVGSKIRVLEKFVTSHLKKRRRSKERGQKGEVVIINGYMAQLGIDDVLTALEAIVHRDILSKEELSDIQAGKSAAKLDERAKNLVETLSNSPQFGNHRPIYLIVHNIDGIALRSYRSQAILSLLASQPQIRLMASIDHVKAPLLFPSTLATSRPSSLSHAGINNSDSVTSLSTKGYNIVYHHLPTFRPYTIESLLSGTFSTIFPPSLFVSDSSLTNGGLHGLEGQSSEGRAKAAFFVLASLTQKSKDVFSLLAERQISLSSSSTFSSKKKSAGGGISMNKDKPPPHSTLYSTLFSLARDKFLANNVNQFEALLREFRDHDVILSSNKRPEGMDEEEEEEGNEGDREEVGQRSGEWVWIAIEREELTDLLERLKT